MTMVTQKVCAHTVKLHGDSDLTSSLEYKHVKRMQLQVIEIELKTTKTPKQC